MLTPEGSDVVFTTGSDTMAGIDTILSGMLHFRFPIGW